MRAGVTQTPSRNNPGCGIYVVKERTTAVLTAVVFDLVDPKGIEPSNLTDANRALSQLSYGPVPFENSLYIIPYFGGL